MDPGNTTLFPTLPFLKFCHEHILVFCLKSFNYYRYCIKNVTNLKTNFLASLLKFNFMFYVPMSTSSSYPWAYAVFIFTKSSYNYIFRCVCLHYWRRRWHPTPVLLPGKSHGRRSLVGSSPRGLEELDTTKRLHFHFSLSCIGEGNGNPLQCSCLENPRDGGAWWAAVYGVTQSRTQLKWLSSLHYTIYIFPVNLSYNTNKQRGKALQIMKVPLLCNWTQDIFIRSFSFARG